MNLASVFPFVLLPGFLESEMGEEILPVICGKYPETPPPREMIDLEVGFVCFWLEKYDRQLC